MTTSQPPSADANPGQPTGGAQPAGQDDSPRVPGPVRPATLAGAVLALLTYLCGFFGAYEYFFPMILVLAGGLLAVIGLLPKVGRTLVPASVLTASGFFLLLLNATSPGYSAGAVKWVALALALLSAAAVVAALLFEVGVLTAPAPRPARPPQPPAGWSPYGQSPYGQAPPPGQGGLFDQGAYGQGYPNYQGYGAPGSYGYGAQGQPGYGTPGYGQQQAPGTPGYGASASGGYGAVGSGGSTAYGSGYGTPGTPGTQAAPGTPGYGAAGQPGYPGAGSPYGSPSSGAPDTAFPGASGTGSPASGPQAASGSPSFGSTGSGSAVPGAAGAQTPATQVPATTPGADQAPGSQPAGGTQTPASAPTLAPAGDGTPDTTPGVPAAGGAAAADSEDERTRSFRPDGSPGPA